MRFIADLHVHSKFSRATSKSLDLESLYSAARLKGITVVGTGDFTHPGWFAELKEKLTPAEDGLFRLRDEVEKSCEERLAVSPPGEVRFMLTCEISNIYKKNGRVRKNHNLVLMPDLETCERFNSCLSRIGNISSDGRPILGLDARDLLEIVLEISETAYLIPAHIWTPWFSLLGSKSGFDSVEECFEDLSGHIFAVETGLSSDPAMNWMVSDLERFTLVSNSDAHSAAKLGREANWFDTRLDYFAIRQALSSQKSDGFLGTFEFFAEEGKYHYDGHRKCGICWSPEQTAAARGKCPVCGRPLTRGVLNRVMALADRRPDHRPVRARPYYSLVPLSDILSEIFRVGPATKKVGQWYQRALSKIGSEFEILHLKPTEDIDRAGIPLLAEAIKRMRDGRIDIAPGFDGEFGRIRIFADNERDRLMGQHSLFAGSGWVEKPSPAKRKKPRPRDSYRPAAKKRKAVREAPAHAGAPTEDPLEGLNSAQREAARISRGFLLIVAGPGTGKTRTLTRKIAFLMKAKAVPPDGMLALTFTNRAAEEMRERLRLLVGKDLRMPLVATFHGFCMQLLEDRGRQLIDEHEQGLWVKEAVVTLRRRRKTLPFRASELQRRIAEAKQRILTPADLSGKAGTGSALRDVAEAYRIYQEMLESQGRMDFEDLIMSVVQRLESDAAFRSHCRERFRYIFIDEYQDINHGQYRLVKNLSMDVRHLCAIGDPDQSIYGFRGSKVAYFTRFTSDFTGAAMVRLTRNYRSAQTILDAAVQVIGAGERPERACDTSPVHARPTADEAPELHSGIKGHAWIDILEAPTERAEAVAVGKVVEEMVGGMSLHAIDSGKIRRLHSVRQYSFSDFAVLYRTGAQGKVLSEVFTAAGIPHQVASRESVLLRPAVAGALSLLKVLERRAGLFDLERVAALHPTARRVSRRSWRAFRKWCCAQRLSLEECMHRVRRFPIAGIDTLQQRRMDELIRDLQRLGERLAGLSLRDSFAALLEQEAFGLLGQAIDADRQSREIIERLLQQAELKQQAFLADMALESDTDLWMPGVERVALMTMHAAKGLEFPVVFITGCEEGFIPYARDGAAVDVEEERRLFYVAMTRARERLFLVRAGRRVIHGKRQDRRPSPFLADIDSGLLRSRTSADRRNARPREVQLKLF